MAPGPSRLSSGSDSDPRNATLDEKRRRRMESNRESARRSRLRKQKAIDDRAAEVTLLKSQNCQLAQAIDLKSHMTAKVQASNNELRAEVAALTDRLASLNSVLQIIEETSGLSVDIPEIPDMIVNQWQLPYPPQQQVMASFNPLQGHQ